MNLERYASRKFLLACAAFLSGVAFFAFGMLTADQWLTHCEWALGLYLAGNVADTAVTQKEKP